MFDILERLEIPLSGIAIYKGTTGIDHFTISATIQIFKDSKNVRSGKDNKKEEFTKKRIRLQKQNNFVDCLFYSF